MITKSSRIKDLYTGNSVLEGVLERFNLVKSFSNDTLADACTKNSLEPNFVVAILKAFSDQYPFPAKELLNFSLQSILSYLRRTHQFYLEKKIPEIELSFVHLSREYSFSHPQLILLGTMFMHYKEELEEHIDHEEYILFPYIEGLLKAREKGKSIFALGLDKYSICDFEHEHHHDELVLSEIRSSIYSRFHNTAVPFPFKIFLNQIESLEKDLLKHARLEDEVLLPMAIGIEKEIKGL